MENTSDGGILITAPQNIVYNTRINLATKGFYYSLLQHISICGSVPSRDVLVKLFGISKDTYSKYINLLTAAGLITTIQNRNMGKFTGTEMIFHTDYGNIEVPCSSDGNKPCPANAVTVPVFKHTEDAHDRLNLNDSQNLNIYNNNNKDLNKDLNKNKKRSSSSSGFTTSLLEEDEEIFSQMLSKYPENKEGVTLFKRAIPLVREDLPGFTFTFEEMDYAYIHFQKRNRDKEVFNILKFVKTCIINAITKYRIDQEKKPELNNIKAKKVNVDEILEERIARNKSLLEKRRREVFSKHQEMRVLNDKVESLFKESMSFFFKGETELEKSKKEERVRAEGVMREKLKSFGYSEDYLDDIITCTICNDKGLLQDASLCNCVK